MTNIEQRKRDALAGYNKIQSDQCCSMSYWFQDNADLIRACLAPNPTEAEIAIDYCLEKMPNGNFVGEVYYLTHDVIKALGCEQNNDQFIAAETAIRNYVWKACQRAATSQRGPEGGQS